MDEFLYIDTAFERTVLLESVVEGREFDGCTFRNCDFSGTRFGGCTFIDCEFLDCNLSMAQLPGSFLKSVTFRDCKIMGVRFDLCENFLFEVRFFDSALDYSWFSDKKMPKTPFRNCSLKGVNFVGTDLTASDFTGADLTDAVFDGTNLERADLCEARNYRFDPQSNQLKNAIFGLGGLHGLLDKYQIIIK